ncbi:Acetyltransferase (GNAT) family protein [Vibrio aerogenes CECT 7868]|uniref:Acetyltransferase (GNAT) family protein n=1 Tax=Vibrio aerogenes CECT 7868 TaxID=1216006 RepID=A0A1M5Z8L6_9VIBR|nr:GNAT family N-acetyltransferase [Vibrio aerogenes]SHI20253.1 Acetyltransferase (GNAT) family protein [Vibrio aerogenes CECT 7868]
MYPDAITSERHQNVRLIRMTIRYLPEVSRLKVNEEQLPFVGHIMDILSIVSGTVYPHLVMAGEKIVGFFLIDTAYGERYDFAHSDSLGLRGFFIDRQFQGKGYGKQAVQLLSVYLPPEYPDHQSIYLTVNCRNPGAQHCYLNAGFNETNQLYYGGDAGPQHVMKLDFQ